MDSEKVSEINGHGCCRRKMCIRDRHYYQELKERGIPILFFNSRYPDLELPCVSMNDEQVGKKAVEYLIKNGHRNIGGVFKSDDGQGHLRYKGFLSGMLGAGIKVKDANEMCIRDRRTIHTE